MLRLAYQAGKFAYLVIGSVAVGAKKHANPPVRKIPGQFLEHGNDRGILLSQAKNQFVIGIVLAAEAGEILVSLRIEAANRLEVADGRGETARPATGRGEWAAEEPPGTVKDEQIIDEGEGSYRKHRIAQDNRSHHMEAPIGHRSPLLRLRFQR